MSTAAERETLDAAWWLMPQSTGAPSSVGTFTSIRMNRVINLIAGLACMVLGAQAFLAALSYDGHGLGFPSPSAVTDDGDVRPHLSGCARGLAVRC